MRIRRLSSYSGSVSPRFVRIATAVFGLVAAVSLLGVAPASATTTSVPIAGGVINVLASPDGSTVYVAGLFSNNVTAIDATTRTVTATIPVGVYPSAMAISPDGATLYVGNELGESVSEVDTATNVVTGTIQLTSYITGLAVSPNGQTLYATSINDGTVTVIDVGSGIVTTTISVGAAPYGIVVSPDGSTVYVALDGANAVAVISTATNTLTQTIQVGTQPAAVAVSPDGATVYVTNGPDNTISAIDTASSTVTHIIPVGSFPDGVAVSPDGTAVYTSNEDNTVSEISTATNTQIATYPAGDVPNRIALSPDGLTAYTANDADSTVSIIDLTPPAAAVIAAGTPPTGTVGLAYSFTVSATGNPTPTYTVTTGTLPDGLTLDAASGQITGTPTTAGPATVGITATNGIGAASSKNYSFTINAATVTVAPLITSGTPTAPQVGTLYSFTVTATGSPAPGFSVTSGTLPAGLSLDAITGAITGTPTTAGNSTFQISADNGVGAASVATYQVTTTAAATDPTTPAAVLGATGVDPLPAGILGGAVILIGAGLLAVGRRRRAPAR
jgi:YVTN family beta-propeller protein